MRGVAVVLGWVMAAWLMAGAAIAQVGFDRPGGDYTRFDLPNGDPATCAARCEREGRCRAWAFSYPMTEEADAICWLKSRVPARIGAPFVVSGVKGGGVIEPRAAVEYSIDRFGGDYRNLAVPAEADGRSCQQACLADNKCRAWTYVRPGYNRSTPHCYLKDRVTPPRRKPCCISGVTR